MNHPRSRKPKIRNPKSKIPLACLVFLILANPQAQCDTYDDDTVLEFYWKAASGDVQHYNVYLSVDEGDFFFVGKTESGRAPTEENPYAVPEKYIEDGKKYRLKVQAEGANGVKGDMSEPSDLVWCKLKLRSPGDMNGPTPGDADGDLRVSYGDFVILRTAWGTHRGDSSFDYRADLNYDDFVDILDLVVMGRNWGMVYRP